jgi:hypothetical protein
MSPQIAIAFVATCGVLASCGRPKTASRLSEPDKYSRVVMIQIPGANVPVPNKDAEEWAIRKAMFFYQVKAMKDGPLFLGIESVYQPKTIRQPMSVSTSGALVPPPPPPPPQPPVVTQLPIPDAMIGEIKRMAAADVRRSSECEITEQGVVDKATGKVQGHLICIRDILWITPTEAEVSGEWWTSPTSLSSERYRLTKTNGVWQVMGTTWGRFREQEPIGCDG